MEQKREKTELIFRLERFFGILFLLPSIFRIFLFIVQLSFSADSPPSDFQKSTIVWIKSIYRESDSSSLSPIYFGLLTIAGAFLLKGTDKKKNVQQSTKTSEQDKSV